MLVNTGGGFQSRGPQQLDDFMIGKRVTQFLPADHRFEREDEDGNKIEFAKDNCEIVVIAEPVEKRGVMKMMKLQRVVAGYFLSGKDMDENVIIPQSILKPALAVVIVSKKGT